MSDLNERLLILLVAATDLRRQLGTFIAEVSDAIAANEATTPTHDFAPPPFAAAELDEPPSRPA